MKARVEGDEKLNAELQTLNTQIAELEEKLVAAQQKAHGFKADVVDAKAALIQFKKDTKDKKKELGLPDRVTKKWLENELIDKYLGSTAAQEQRHQLVLKEKYAELELEVKGLEKQRKADDALCTDLNNKLCDLAREKVAVEGQVEILQESREAFEKKQEGKNKALFEEKKLLEENLEMCAKTIRGLKSQLRMVWQTDITMSI